MHHRAPALALALALALGASVACQPRTGSKFPAEVDPRAYCYAQPPADGVIENEAELLAWLERDPEYEREIAEQFGGRTSECQREKLGEIDWATQHVLFFRHGNGTRIERISVRGSTLHVAYRSVPQCGGAEIPEPPAGSTLLVTPTKLDTVEWKQRSRELCDWQKPGGGGPPP